MARERVQARELLIGNDGLSADGFVELATRGLAEHGYVQRTPGAVRPVCHLAKNGTGAWLGGLAQSQPARDIARFLAATTSEPVWVLEAVTRKDGSNRINSDHEVEVAAWRVFEDGRAEAATLETLPASFATRETLDQADPKILAERSALDALHWAWGSVRTRPATRRMELGQWTPPPRGYRRVAGVTSPSDAILHRRIQEATTRELVERPGGPELRLTLADGSRQIRVLTPKEALWVRRMFGP
jgi:hypothetical protein